MALNENVRGAIHSQCLPFPLGEKEDSSLTNYDKLLGREFDLPNGCKARLVKSSGAVADPEKKVFKYTSKADFTVEVAGTGEVACGVAHPKQLADLVAGDFLFLLIQGNVTCIDSGVGLAAGAIVEPAAAGEVRLQDAAATDQLRGGAALGTVLEVAAADADVDIALFNKLMG